MRGGDEVLVRMAQESRPEVQAAAAAAANSRSALSLARADRIPIPSIGPAYERNETGAVFYGVALTSPVPLLNAGNSLVGQRERNTIATAWPGNKPQQVATQVVATLVKWNQAQQAAGERRHGSNHPPANRTDERLYGAGQTDLLKLLQVRRRFIEARNVELDTIWQTTQAYADLLSATAHAAAERTAVWSAVGHLECGPGTMRSMVVPLWLCRGAAFLLPPTATMCACRQGGFFS